MKLFGKLLFTIVMGLLLGVSLFFTIPSSTGAEDYDFIYEGGNGETGPDAVDIGGVIKTVGIDPDDSASEKIQEAFKINFEADGEQRATFYIKEIINWFLAISGLVALIVLIYGFYKMFVAKDNEEGYKNARKVVISAVVALFVIGTAWIVVSQFFDIFFRVKADTDT